MHNCTTPTSEQKDQLMLWTDAPDLETLFRLNTEYIEGQLNIHPAHSEPVDPETKGISSSLLQMNQFGLFTFQGQPYGNGGSPQPPNTVPMCDSLGTNNPQACRYCAQRYSRNYTKWTEQRQLAYVQFCVVIGGSIDAATVETFADRLLQDKRVHTLISWPKSIALPLAVLHDNADLSSARYIPARYLESYKHIKSTHGTSCADQIRTADTESGLTEASWDHLSGIWPEVNDYHLLEPGMPEWYFHSNATKPFVFGVNAIEHDIELDIQLLILEAIKASTPPASVSDVKQAPSTIVDYQRL
ncbi:methylenetetrahydrofolate reductase (NAD(P)H) met13 [Elasticomyces elasticus]|nr:methylenetetrahydrofolate reductase (NAD(P)H) met13 [Elasticomyces elasticus]KAK3631425.1 methylenetetrahydrofolate reductase (NAD(P)H) met13 [Elasticomyces elasticus]KAK4913892.1 methylenetetrahydrofolate reductase (NAD(P)H) met13 [Elasticomyces elasticus]KAK5766353.1 methylenetetrahydrofolate reductase (NAD(P)H) met13 [Elasticomyces elasticus]